VIAHGLYGVLDTGCLLRDVPRARDSAASEEALLLEALSLLLRGGVRDVQLRCKDDEARPRRARWVARHMRGARARLWINDDVALARELRRTHADGSLTVGVHLGQGDGPDPDDVPFGRSTHTLAQVAAPGRAAYLGFGPVFGTRTKQTSHDARGVAMLAQAVRASDLPLVAIGGITPANVRAVAATGVHAWTAISALWDAPARDVALRCLTSVP
jgi:thiamine-phosphate pyrophosphorylase